MTKGIRPKAHSLSTFKVTFWRCAGQGLKARAGQRRGPYSRQSSCLANFKFCGFANQHLNALFEQRAAVRIAQLNVVVTRSKCKFLGLLDLVGKSTVHVDRGVL